MPPEAPPPPGLLPSRGFSRWSFPRYAAGESGFGEKLRRIFLQLSFLKAIRLQKIQQLREMPIILFKFYG